MRDENLLKLRDEPFVKSWDEKMLRHLSKKTNCDKNVHVYMSFNILNIA